MASFEPMFEHNIIGPPILAHIISFSACIPNALFEEMHILLVVSCTTLRLNHNAKRQFLYPFEIIPNPRWLWEQRRHIMWSSWKSMPSFWAYPLATWVCHQLFWFCIPTCLEWPSFLWATQSNAKYNSHVYNLPDQTSSRMPPFKDIWGDLLQTWTAVFKAVSLISCGQYGIVSSLLIPRFSQNLLNSAIVNSPRLSVPKHFSFLPVWMITNTWNFLNAAKASSLDFNKYILAS